MTASQGTELGTSIFEFALKEAKRNIADDGKDRGQGERRIDDRRRWLRQAEGLALQEASIAEDAVGRGEGKQQRDERVEVHRFGEVSAE